MCIHIYLPTLGEQVYEAPQLTLYIKMSVAQRLLSPHRRMNLQHVVQHSLNTSLARLHTNKPAGTCGLTPTRLISTLSLPVRSELRAKRTCLFAFVDVKNALIIFASTQNAQTCFRCMNNRIIISFLRVQIN